MKYLITLHKRDILYAIRRSQRAKRLRIAVYNNTEVIVTLPKGKKKADAEIYLKKKAKWILATIDSMRVAKGLALRKSKKNIYQIIEKIIEKYSKIYNINRVDIAIKNYKTKWGSCSKKTLSFNAQIETLPNHLIEYVAIHELCHLIHHDHTQKFINLQTREMPDWEKWKNKLEKLLA